MPFCGGCGTRLTGEGPGIEVHGQGPGLWMALGLYAASLLTILGLLLAEGAGNDTTFIADWIMLGVAGIAVALNPRATLPLFRLPRLTWTGVAITGAAIGLILGFVQLLVSLAPDLFVDTLEMFAFQDASLALVIFSMAVMPAIAEEIIFRGPILGGLKNTFGTQTAIWVSAAMFATLHLSVLSTIHLLALGVLTATVRIRTRSLWPAIAIHFTYNAAIVLIDWTQLYP